MSGTEFSTSFVGTIPERYDRLLGPVFFDPSANDLSARVDLSALPILELASGTGRLTGPLLRRLPPPHGVFALDLNTTMQLVARRRVTDRRMRLVTGDAMRLPFADRLFAQVVCQYGIMFFPDKGFAASEVRRVLVPGGVFLFNVWGSLDENPLGEIAHRVINRYFSSDQTDFFQIPFGYYDFEQIRADLARGGFTSVEMTTIDLEGRCESAAHIAQGLVTGSPVSVAITQRARAPHQEIADAIARELEQRFGRGAFNVPMRAHVIRAR